MTIKTGENKTANSVGRFLSKKEGNDIVSRGTGIAIVAAFIIFLFVILPALGVH